MSTRRSSRSSRPGTAKRRSSSAAPGSPAAPGASAPGVAHGGSPAVTAPAWQSRPFRITAISLATVVLLLLGFIAGWLIPRWSAPGDTSAEAGFARDMSEHHAQAVEMGMIAYPHATLPDIRTLGGDIALTQQAQIGMMRAWLADWGLNITGSQPPMAWMPEGDRAMRGNLMPGMATREEVAKLRAATGKEVDILFCQYMLRHHQGGIHMVDELLKQVDSGEVAELAETMKRNQAGEIAVLQTLLTQLGAQPL